MKAEEIACGSLLGAVQGEKYNLDDCLLLRLSCSNNRDPSAVSKLRFNPFEPPDQ